MKKERIYTRVNYKKNMGLDKVSICEGIYFYVPRYYTENDVNTIIDEYRRDKRIINLGSEVKR